MGKYVSATMFPSLPRVNQSKQKNLNNLPLSVTRTCTSLKPNKSLDIFTSIRLFVVLSVFVSFFTSNAPVCQNFDPARKCNTPFILHIFISSD